MSTTHLIMSDLWTNDSVLAKNKNNLANDSQYLDDLLEKALQQLREDKAIKRQCLEQMRDWIKQNRDLENCFTDDLFLLRFLRMKKFSIPMAQQVLLKYLSFRKKFKHIMYDLDYTNSKVEEIINNGYIFASPFRDSYGRRVIIYNISRFDPHKYTSTDMSRAHSITYETLITDEKNQILGVNHVGDLNGFNPAIVTLWSTSEFATLIRWGEQSFPMRHKEINLINLPTTLKYIFDFSRSLMSPKLKERFTIHNTVADLYKKINRDCLPMEMGGVMPMKDMIELWKKELEEKRNLLLTYDTMNLLSDRGITTRKNYPTVKSLNIESLPGSFRKLEVD